MKKMIFLLISAFVLAAAHTAYAQTVGEPCPTGQVRDVAGNCVSATLLDERDRITTTPTDRNASDSTGFSVAGDMNQNTAVSTSVPLTGEQIDTGRGAGTIGSIDANRQPSRSAGISAAGIVPTNVVGVPSVPLSTTNSRTTGTRIGSSAAIGTSGEASSATGAGSSTGVGSSSVGSGSSGASGT